MVKKNLIKKNMLIFNVMLFILTAHSYFYAAQERDCTLLEAIANHITGKKFPFKAQKIIFDYLKNPVTAIGFITIKGGSNYSPTWCSYGGLAKGLQESDTAPADIITVMGLDSGLDAYYLTIFDLAPEMIATEKNPPNLAFDPKHFGIWFVPSEEEALLSSQVADGHDMSEVEEKTIKLITRNKKKQLKIEGWRDNYNFTKPTRWENLKHQFQTPVASSKPTWFEKLKQTLHTPIIPTPKTGFNKLIIGTNGEQLPLLAQTIIFEYLQSKALKEKTMYCTDKGLKSFLAYKVDGGRISQIIGSSQKNNIKNCYANFPGVSVDCIEGKDEHGRKHLIVNEASTCVKPDHYASLHVADNQSLVSIAKEPFVVFYVPGPEEEALKGIENKHEKQKFQWLEIIKNNESIKNELVENVSTENKQCLIQ